MIGVAINPTNPEGKRFDADRLEKAIGEAAGEAPVWVFEKES
jgi:histidinol-phosphate/aromatic aminotransferase/cobyric acid decarboxylase-like protein